MGLQEESFDFTNNEEGMVMNLVLCDVVIENILSGKSESNNDHGDYNRITVYFKPIDERPEESGKEKAEYEIGDKRLLSEPGVNESCPPLSEDLIEEDKNERKLAEICHQIQNISNQLEQVEKQKAEVKVLISASIRAIKNIHKKSINRRTIALNKRQLHELRQGFLVINKRIKNLSQQLQELQGRRIDLETYFNKCTIEK